MKNLFRCCLAFCCVAVLALPVAAIADEVENFEKDAQSAENTPPVIPHKVKEMADGEYCLACHKTGLKGASVTPHPERLSCTGCHVQGEIRKAKPEKKGSKKK